MEKEIWKDIPEYEGLYQVSNLGRVKSLPKKWFTGIGNIEISHNGLILKPHFCGPNKDYLFVNLRKNKQSKPCKIHQLVAIAFLNHKPCGHKLIVDHINNIPLDNRLENLQIITQRVNRSKDQKGKSKYTGVVWNKVSNMWHSQIYINKKNKSLGCFKTEYEAHLAYQEALKKYNLV
jgi:hypothetical protein